MICTDKICRKKC